MHTRQRLPSARAATSTPVRASRTHAANNNNARPIAPYSSAYAASDICMTMTIAIHQQDLFTDDTRHRFACACIHKLAPARMHATAHAVLCDLEFLDATFPLSEYNKPVSVSSPTSPTWRRPSPSINVHTAHTTPARQDMLTAAQTPTGLSHHSNDPARSSPTLPPPTDITHAHARPLHDPCTLQPSAEWSSAGNHGSYAGNRDVSGQTAGP